MGYTGKTKHMKAIRCNCCQRNLPASCFKLRKRGEQIWREQPCKQCRSYVYPPTEAYKERQRKKRMERYWEKKRAEQAKLNSKRPPPKRSKPPALRKNEGLLIECSTCKAYLPRSEFYRPHKDYICKECHKVEKNARWAKRREEDPEWHAEQLAQLKAWKRAHPEEVRLKRRIHKNRRLARRLENGTHDFTEADWYKLLEIYDCRCFYCGQRGGDKTRDHIVPLAKGGEHTMENIVPCCADCNSKKRQLDLKEFILLRMAA